MATKRTRNYGEGSIYQRKDGRWVFKYQSEEMVKPHYGYAKTETDIKRKLREYKKEVAKGNFETQDSNMLYQDYCLLWLNNVYRNKVASTTFSDRMQLFRRHILNTYIGKMTLINLSQNSIQKHINSIAECSISIAKSVLFIIKNSLTYAYQEGTIKSLFVQNIMIPKYIEQESQKEKDILTVEEVRKIEEYVFDDSNYLDSKMQKKRQLYDYQILFILYTGLRIGEYRAITYEDIDFYHRELSVQNSIAKIHDYETDEMIILKKKPKSESSKRNIPLKTKAISVIQKIIQIQQELGITKDRISAIPNDKYVHSALLKYRIANLLNRTQIDKEIVPHGLRHTFVTLSIDAGIPINIVANWVGHTNIQITQIYNHILKTQRDKGAVLLEAW